MDALRCVAGTATQRNASGVNEP